VGAQSWKKKTGSSCGADRWIGETKPNGKIAKVNPRSGGRKEGKAQPEWGGKGICASVSFGEEGEEG